MSEKYKEKKSGDVRRRRGESREGIARAGVDVKAGTQSDSTEGRD